MHVEIVKDEQTCMQIKDCVSTTKMAGMYSFHMKFHLRRGRRYFEGWYSNPEKLIADVPQYHRVVLETIARWICSCCCLPILPQHSWRILAAWDQHFSPALQILRPVVLSSIWALNHECDYIEAPRFSNRWIFWRFEIVDRLLFGSCRFGTNLERGTSRQFVLGSFLISRSCSPSSSRGRHKGSKVQKP